MISNKLNPGGKALITIRGHKVEVEYFYINKTSFF